jgi:hypothetical protein
MNGYIRSGFSQGDGHGLPETGRGAGNQRYLSVKLELI